MNTLTKFKHPSPTESELRTLANRPVLEEWEASKLMQGMCPNRKIGNGMVTWLDDYDTTKLQVKKDLSLGILSFPIKPNKLLEWCALHKIPLPIEFSKNVNNLIFHLKRVNHELFIDTGELVRGSASCHLTKNVHKNHKKVGRKPKKLEALIRGYESEVCKLVKIFCLNQIKQHGIMPLKKNINEYLSKKLKRSEPDVNRAYTLKISITKHEETQQRRAFRKNKRDYKEDAMQKN